VVIAAESATWFVSLGNGHFSQALSLFRQRVPSVFTGEPFAIPTDDAGLYNAVHVGVPSIVLREDTPIASRRRVACVKRCTPSLTAVRSVLLGCGVVPSCRSVCQHFLVLVVPSCRSVYQRFLVSAFMPLCVSALSCFGGAFMS
jgi:hypothetical protein